MEGLNAQPTETLAFLGALVHALHNFGQGLDRQRYVFHPIEWRYTSYRALEKENVGNIVVYCLLTNLMIYSREEALTQE